MEGKKDLFRTVFDVLYHCEKNGCKSVSLPTISTGRGYSYEEVAHITYWGIRRFIQINAGTSISEINIVVYNTGDARNFFTYWENYCSKDLRNGDDGFKCDKIEYEEVVDEEETQRRVNLEKERIEADYKRNIQELEAKEQSELLGLRRLVFHHLQKPGRSENSLARHWQ